MSEEAKRCNKCAGYIYFSRDLTSAEVAQLQEVAKCCLSIGTASFRVDGEYSLATVEGAMLRVAKWCRQKKIRLTGFIQYMEIPATNWKAGEWRVMNGLVPDWREAKDVVKFELSLYENQPRRIFKLDGPTVPLPRHANGLALDSTNWSIKNAEWITTGRVREAIKRFLSEESRKAGLPVQQVWSNLVCTSLDTALLPPLVREHFSFRDAKMAVNQILCEELGNGDHEEEFYERDEQRLRLVRQRVGPSAADSD